MMMTGSLLTWIQKLAVQHFTFEVQNLFTEVTTFTPVLRLLPGMNYSKRTTFATLWYFNIITSQNRVHRNFQ